MILYIEIALEDLFLKVPFTIFFIRMDIYAKKLTTEEA
jgi:hypothetical protein